MNKTIKEFEDIYSAPSIAPSTYQEIPTEIENLVKNNILPSLSKVLEIGCGEGHHAIYLAKAGFGVVAIDRSPNAIAFAKQNAKDQEVYVDFRVQEHNQIEMYKEKFDFVFDWRFLHEIIDEKHRNRYIETINNVINDKGKYLSVAFSGDSDFMGNGKIRKSPAGIEIYFSTLKEAEKLIGNYFKIIESKTIFVHQKPDLHVKANYILAEKESKN